MAAAGACEPNGDEEAGAGGFCEGAPKGEVPGFAAGAADMGGWDDPKGEDAAGAGAGAPNGDEEAGAGGFCEGAPKGEIPAAATGWEAAGGCREGEAGWRNGFGALLWA